MQDAGLVIKLMLLWFISLPTILFFWWKKRKAKNLAGMNFQADVNYQSASRKKKYADYAGIGLFLATAVSGIFLMKELAGFWILCLWIGSVIAFVVYWWKKRQARLSAGENYFEDVTYKAISKQKRFIGLASVGLFIFFVAVVGNPTLLATPEEVAQWEAEREVYRQKKAEEEKLAAEKKAEEEKLAAEKKAEEEKLAAEKKAEEEKLAAEKKAEEEKLAAQKAEEEKLAAEKKAEEEKLAAEKKAEEEKLAAEKKAEEEKLAAEKKAREEQEKAQQLAKLEAERLKNWGDKAALKNYLEEQQPFAKVNYLKNKAGITGPLVNGDVKDLATYAMMMTFFRPKVDNPTEVGRQLNIYYNAEVGLAIGWYNLKKEQKGFLEGVLTKAGATAELTQMYQEQSKAEDKIREMAEWSGADLSRFHETEEIKAILKAISK